MTSTRVPQQVLPAVAQDESPGDGGSLVARCLRGDDVAWGELVQRYERLVFSIAIRQGLTLEDCADVTQMVFEALFLSLPKLREEQKLASWLVSVTQRQAWRTRSKQLRDVSLYGLTADPDSFSTAAGRGGEPTADLDQSLWVYEALQGLQDPCRTLLLALYFDPAEPSYAEVALRLGRPVGSIGPTRARCLDQLRRILEAEEKR